MLSFDWSDARQLEATQLSAFHPTIYASRKIYKSRTFFSL